MFGKWIDQRIWRENAAVTVPPMDGALRPNQRLEEAEALPAEAPGDLICDDGAVLYASGRALVDLGSGTVVRVFEHPITCLAAGPRGQVAVGLSGAGVHTLHPDKTLAPPAHAHAANATAVTFAGEDLVVCEGAANLPPEAWKHDLMGAGFDGAGSGTVWLVGQDGTARQIAGKLRYPNGVLPVADGGLIVSESWNHRLLMLDPRTGGVPRPVLADLPGYPARLAPAADGGAWLAVFAPRSQLIEFVLREPGFRRRMMAEIAPDFWIAPTLANGRSFLEPLQGGGVKQMGVLKPWAPSRSYGLVIRLDAALHPVMSLHSRADGTRHGTTSVLEARGCLYVASKGGDAILRLTLTELVEA